MPGEFSVGWPLQVAAASCEALYTSINAKAGRQTRATHDINVASKLRPAVQHPTKNSKNSNP